MLAINWLLLRLSLLYLVAKGFWHQKREHENKGSRSKKSKNILAGMNGQDPLCTVTFFESSGDNINPRHYYH